MVTDDLDMQGDDVHGDHGADAENGHENGEAEYGNMPQSTNN